MGKKAFRELGAKPGFLITRESAHTDYRNQKRFFLVFYSMNTRIYRM
jgi:hypothetical protein